MDYEYVEVLIVLLTSLLFIAGSVERLIEIAKPLILKIANEDWQKAVKVLLAVLLGFGLSALLQFNPLGQFKWFVAPEWTGYLAAGMLASAGSSVLHPILEWLKTLKE